MVQRSSVIITLVLAIVLAGCNGCGSVKNGGGTTVLRPGAANQFDQYAYDTLMIAQGSLNQARSQVMGVYPQYKDQFNKTASLYNTVQAGYKVYHDAVVKTPESQQRLQNQINSLITQLGDLLAKMGNTIDPAPGGN